MEDDDDLAVFKIRDDDYGDDDVFGEKPKTRRRIKSKAFEEEDVFEMKNNATKENKDEGNVSKNLNISYDYMLTGNANRDSFPSMAADYTFNHAGVNVIPDSMPALTRKSSQKARKPSSGENEDDKLVFVIDHWRSSGIKKTSVKRKKNIESKEVNEISMNSLSLGSSDPSLKAASKWKTLRHKAI